MNAKSTYQFIPNLSEVVAEKLKDASPKTNIQGQAIYADSVVKVLLFPFAAGQVLEEHVTPHPAILNVIEGQGEIAFGDDRKPVGAGSWAWMEGGLPHSVRAETKMVLLLQVFVKEGKK